MVMASFARNAAACLKKFHKDIEARARQIGTGIAGLHMLQQQVGNYENVLKDLSASVKETINTNQKEINRQFVPIIEQAMAAAYEACVEERGKRPCAFRSLSEPELTGTGTGSFARMKAAMNSHVAQERHTMFQSSAENVESKLNVMLKELEVYMNDKTDEVYIAMRRDYNSVLGGGDVPQNGEILPKTQRLVRKEMIRIIDGVEKVFKKIAGLEVKDEDDEEDKPSSHNNNDDEVEGHVGKKEEDEQSDVKRETTPSGQLKQEASAEPETNLESAETYERLDGRAKVDGDHSESSESSDDSKSS